MRVLSEKHRLLLSSAAESYMNNKKVVLVTGASSGIREALVRELTNRDWIVIGLARKTKKIDGHQK